jgi:hypothetical protein
MRGRERVKRERSVGERETAHFKGGREQKDFLL